MTRTLVAAMCAVIAIAPARLAAQQAPASPPTAQPPHEQHAQADDQMTMEGPLGVSMMRDGSGTSWLPDASPMRAIHLAAGSWQVMLHGNGFLQYVDERTPRTDDQFGSINWVMAMGHRSVGRGMLMLRSMLSAEALTVGECGYPDILATGESCNGRRLHDRQHPHDLFMELAADFRMPITDTFGFEIYGGPVGEPALGPAAYPHRPSAMANPFAPIGHHWLDSTHISFGVVSGGVYGKRWKAEASAFNGREPDEQRYDLDLASLDSVSGRFSFLPSSRWALQVSTGLLREAEQEQQGGPFHDVQRTTASAIYHRPVADAEPWATTIAWGRNAEDEDSTQAVLVETNRPLSARNSVFGRFEVAEKTAVDLVLPIADRSQVFVVQKVSAGYAQEFGRYAGLVPGLGASLSLAFLPQPLESTYDGRRSVGFAVFFSLRPPRMEATTTSP